MRPSFKDDWPYFSSALEKILEIQGPSVALDVLKKSSARVEESGWDNWDGGTQILTAYLSIDLEFFASISDQLKDIESQLDKASEPLARLYPQEWFGFQIIPSQQSRFDYASLLDLLDKQSNLMVSVATGGPKIADCNDDYKDRDKVIRKQLRGLGLDYPVVYRDLWQWHNMWRADLPTWASRRAFVADLFSEIRRQIEDCQVCGISTTLTGWARIDRVLALMPRRIQAAQHEEHYQEVGLNCRELLITLAQEVYDESMAMHCDKEPGKSDSKRQLEAFVSRNMTGEVNKLLRKYVRSAIDLTSELTHRRSASKSDAIIVFSSTKSLVEIIHEMQLRCKAKSSQTAEIMKDDIPF